MGSLPPDGSALRTSYAWVLPHARRNDLQLLVVPGRGAGDDIRVLHARMEAIAS